MHPEIRSAFSAHFDCDCVDWSVSGFLAAQRFAVAVRLSTSGADLATIQAEIERLISGDRDLLLELNKNCGWDWDDDPETMVALKEVLLEVLAALRFRIRWDTSHAAEARGLSSQG